MQTKMYILYVGINKGGKMKKEKSFLTVFKLTNLDILIYFKIKLIQSKQKFILKSFFQYEG